MKRIIGKVSMIKLREKRGSATLVALLIVVVIGMLIYLYMGGYIGHKSSAVPSETSQSSSYKAAIDQGKEASCQNNLRQIRYAITMYQNSEGKNPADIMEIYNNYGLKSPGLQKCPAGGEPYMYDPATGIVRCVHPGHTGF